MDIKIEALEGNRVKVDVTIDAKQVDARISKEYKELAARGNFPGFRKGKAPRPVIDSAYGKEAILVNVTEELINDNYPLAIDQANLFPIGKPDFPEPELVATGKPFTYTFEVDVKPEFELSSYEPAEVQLPPEKATPEEVEDQIGRLLEHYAEYVNAPAATKIKADSRVELELRGLDELDKEIPLLTDESFNYTMGSGLLPQEFEDEILGMKRNQEKSFVMVVPGNPTAYTSGLIGKTPIVKFDVKVKYVKKAVLPELTDEWVVENFGFENVAELNERMAEDIEREKSEFMPRMKENVCAAAISARMEDEIPQSMVDEAEANLLQDFFGQLQDQGMSFDDYLKQAKISADQFKEDIKRQAADDAKEELALDAWARNKGIECTEEDLLAEFKNAGAENPERMLKDWKETGRLFMLRGAICRRKAMEDIMDTAVVSDLVPKKKAAAKKKAAKKAEEAPAEAPEEAPAEE